MTMRGGIVFDKDGTLFDFAATWEAWAKGFLLKLGGDAQRGAELGNVIGFDMDACQFRPDSVVIAGTPGEIADALQPYLPELGRDDLLEVMNTEAANAPQAEAVPLAPLLDGLRGAGWRLGVVTNDAEAPARAHLESAGVTDRFDFIAGFDSGYGGKPAPGGLFGFAQALALDPATCVMVGDSRHDLMAGRAAGFRTVAVLTGMAKAADLADLADVVLPDIGHLPAWLEAT